MNIKNCITNDLMALEVDTEKLEVLIDDLQDGYFDKLMTYGKDLPPYMHSRAELRLHMMRDYVNQMQDTIKVLLDGMNNDKD